MTWESLHYGIFRLVDKRRNLNPQDTEELDRINKKLDKLYMLRYTMIQQNPDVLNIKLNLKGN